MQRPAVTPNWLRHLTLALAIIVFGLIFAGAQVTSHDAGLAVPDWPKAYGEWFPEGWIQARNVFIEHLHRIYAFVVGWAAVGLAAAFYFFEPRAVLRKLAFVLPVLVLAQALIGAARVLVFANAWLPVLHGIFGQLTFSAFVILALLTQPKDREETAPAPKILRRGLAALWLLIFSQLVLGAVMRHARAGLAIPDFPLLRGTLPDLGLPGAWLAFSHRVLGVLVCLALLAQAILLARPSGGIRALRGAGFGLAALAIVQIALGIFTVLSGRNPWLASFHTSGGALILVLQMRLWLKAGAGSSMQNPAGA